MKHIIPFIIMLTITCYGQPCKQWDGKHQQLKLVSNEEGYFVECGSCGDLIPLKRDIGHVSLTFDSGLLTEAPNIMTWENFIENWQGYQSECGESERCYEVYVTGKDTGYAPCTDRIDPGANQAYRGRVTKTIKNKPTFEGFMQFLVKKYRKE
jgi:hypothetical protein